MDGRRARGDRTRSRVAQRAAELASLDGLGGLSFGHLASEVGLSKSSVATLYGTKEGLQLAAVAAARRIFIQHVLLPTAGLPPGLPKLRGVLDAWLVYASTPVFPGGCFMVATAAEFDSHPGPVRDALAQMRRDWLGVLAAEIEHAQSAGQLQQMAASLLAFEIDALLAAANISANLLGDTGAMAAAREILRVRLGE